MTPHVRRRRVTTRTCGVPRDGGVWNGSTDRTLESVRSKRKNGDRYGRKPDAARRKRAPDRRQRSLDAPFCGAAGETRRRNVSLQADKILPSADAFDVTAASADARAVFSPENARSSAPAFARAVDRQLHSRPAHWRSVRGRSIRQLHTPCSGPRRCFEPHA